MAFIPDEAVDRMSEISPGAWKLYCFLARCRNQKTGKCCPSINVIMETIGTKRSQTYQFRKELVRTGWATFDGNNVITLFGFNIPKYRTSNSDNKDVTGNSPKSRNIPKSRTGESEIPDSLSEIPDKTVRNPGLLYKEEPAKEPANRTSKDKARQPSVVPPSVAYIRQLTHRYPDKTLWPRIVQTLGEDFDQEQLTNCYENWVSHGWNKMNLVWLFEWYVTGIPARTVAAPQKQNPDAYVGKNKPTTEKPMDAETVNAEMLEIIDTWIELGDFIHLGHEYDAIIKRGGPKAEWEIAVVAYYELHKNEPATPEQMAQLNASIDALVKR